MEQEYTLVNETDNSVLELLDRVLNTGVVVAGDITITVADIELIYLRLQLLVSSAETARQAGWLWGTSAGRDTQSIRSSPTAARE